MKWLMLIVAGLLEMGGAIGLKYSQGFTKLIASIFTKEMLLKCHKQLVGNKTTGIDDVTKQKYSVGNIKIY